MNARLCGWSAVGLAALLGASCKTNPVADLAGKAAFVSITPKAGALVVGTSPNMKVIVLDETLTPLQVSVQATSVAPDTVTVAPATGLPPDPSGTSSVFTLTGVHAGTGYIRFTGGGITDSGFVEVLKASPTLTSHPAPDTAKVNVDVLNDSATVASGFNASGSIIFKLYRSNDSTCVSPFNTQTVTVNGNGKYATSPGFTPDTTGTWRWTAAYSGDANNHGAATGCSDERVTVTP